MPRPYMSLEVIPPRKSVPLSPRELTTLGWTEPGRVGWDCLGMPGFAVPGEVFGVPEGEAAGWDGAFEGGVVRFGVAVQLASG